MTPDERRNARARLEMFLSPTVADYVRVSRGELAEYLGAALAQIDTDEGLILNLQHLVTFWVPERVQRTYSFMDALRARLGDLALEEPKP